MDWLRLWHDLPTDPKWRVIAQKSSSSIAEVIAVYVYLLVNASGNDMKRGVTHGIVSEDMAIALGVHEETIEAILFAMQGKVLDGEQITGWEKRQVKREDSSTSRVQKHREEKMKRTVTPGNARLDKKRLEEIREEKNKTLFPELAAQDVPVKASLSQITKDFDEDWLKFWSPRKERPDALKAYIKARAKIDRQTLMAAVVRQGPLLITEAASRNGTVVHQSTWLNKERWTDEISEIAPTNGHGPPRRFKTRQEEMMDQVMEEMA